MGGVVKLKDDGMLGPHLVVDGHHDETAKAMASSSLPLRLSLLQLEEAEGGCLVGLLGAPGPRSETRTASEELRKASGV